MFKVIKCEWLNKSNEKAFYGMDSIFYVDGRFNAYSAMLQATKIKNSYMKNFPHKYNTMNRFNFRGQIIQIEHSEYNNNKLREKEILRVIK